MKVRLATEIGKVKTLRKYWAGVCNKDSYHRTARLVIQKGGDEVQFSKDHEQDYAHAEKIEEVCKCCGIYATIDDKVEVSLGIQRVYDTPSGELEPGCLYWNTWYPKNTFFDNQEGPMLEVMLPNGSTWNIDSRASNCDMPNDRTHRCWVRHGEVPNIHVDKQGHTCGAGAGSILVEGYHGFLRNGELVTT